MMQELRDEDVFVRLRRSGSDTAKGFSRSRLRFTCEVSKMFLSFEAEGVSPCHLSEALTLTLII